MATTIAQSIRNNLSQMQDSIIERLDPSETRIPWPGQSKSVWPRADISGLLATKEVFIIEIDDHADPVRSIVKYWPLVHETAQGTFEHASIAFVEVSKRDNTYGYGFQLLAQFVGRRFLALYPEHFRFQYISLKNDAPTIANQALAFFHEVPKRHA